MSTKIEKPADWFATVLPAKVSANASKAGAFNGTFSFNITGENGGTWSVTLEGAAVSVKQEMDPTPAFVITIKSEDFVKLINGELNGQVAFMTGKLRFKGSMGTAMKLQPLLF